MNIRIDENVKKQFDAFCSEVGMNTSVAINLFAKAVIREKRIPFEISTVSSDEMFYSESNLKHLRRGIAALDRGQGVEHGLAEVDE